MPRDHRPSHQEARRRLLVARRRRDENFWPWGLILTILAREGGIQVRSGKPASSPATRDSDALAHSFCARPLGFSCCLLLLAMAQLVVARGSSIAAVLSARSTARQLLERACMMPSPCGHDALAVSAQVCPASSASSSFFPNRAQRAFRKNRPFP